MTYVRAYADWKDFPDTSTPISESKLDTMDAGIYNAHYNAIVQSDAVGQVPLTARGIAAQTADLFRVQNNTPTTLVKVDSTGALFLNTDVKLTRFAAATLGVEAEVRVIRPADASAAITLKGLAGQPLAQILASGLIQWGDGGGTYDTQISRSAVNTLSMGNNDRFVVGSGGVQYSDGTIQTSAASNTSGTLALRPVQPYNAGAFYFATDQVVLYFSTGSSWLRTGDPAGHSVMWPSNTIPSGWVLFDGSNLPASTGIYADMFAALGTLTTPNMKGNVPVGRDATQTEFDTILEQGGAKTHTLAGTEIDHTHGTVWVTGNYSGSPSPAFPAVPGFSISNGGVLNTTPHNNLQPYRTTNFIGKL